MRNLVQVGRNIGQQEVPAPHFRGDCQFVGKAVDHDVGTSAAIELSGRPRGRLGIGANLCLRELQVEDRAGISRLLPWHVASFALQEAIPQTGVRRCVPSRSWHLTGAVIRASISSAPNTTQLITCCFPQSFSKRLKWAVYFPRECGQGSWPKRWEVYRELARK